MKTLLVHLFYHSSNIISLAFFDIVGTNAQPSNALSITALHSNFVLRLVILMGVSSHLSHSIQISY